MNLISQIVLFSVIVLTLTVGVHPVRTQENTWAIGPRTLPPSVDVENEFRAALLNTYTLDTVTAESNIPETTEQWGPGFE